MHYSSLFERVVFFMLTLQVIFYNDYIPAKNNLAGSGISQTRDTLEQSVVFEFYIALRDTLEQETILVYHDNNKTFFFSLFKNITFHLNLYSNSYLVIRRNKYF